MVQLDDVLVSQFLDTVCLLVDRVNFVCVVHYTESIEKRVKSVEIRGRRVESQTHGNIHNFISERRKGLTCLGHVHILNSVLLVVLATGRQMYRSKSALSNLFLHAVVIKYGAIIKSLTCNRQSHHQRSI